MKRLQKATDSSDPRIFGLFEESIPSNPVIHSALEQDHPSTVYVDDLENPRRAILHMRFGNFVCYARQPDSEFLVSGLNRIRQKSIVELYWPSSMELRQAPSGFDRVRLFFEYFEHLRSVKFYEKFYQNGLGDLRIVPIDEPLMERCAWREYLYSIYGDFRGFEKAGFGFALCDGDRPLSEAYAGFLGMGVAEIGLVTREDVRRKGHATMTCAYLIAHCLRLGYSIRWSCGADNVASIKTAERLGFRGPMKSKILKYPRL